MDTVREVLPPTGGTGFGHIAGALWSLYQRHAASPAIEWDNDVPPYPILAGEVERAHVEVVEASKRDIRQR